MGYGLWDNVDQRVDEGSDAVQALPTAEAFRMSEPLAIADSP
jgi:hypothetical protein